jgi:hypothetical protein
VRVFDGGLFDKFGGTELALDDGTCWPRATPGFAWTQGQELGWPPVTPEDVDDAGGKIRQGLPRDYPESASTSCSASTALFNEPGPTVRVGRRALVRPQGRLHRRHVGQIGGLLSYDFARPQWHGPAVSSSSTRRSRACTRARARSGSAPRASASRRSRASPASISFRPSARRVAQFSIRNSRISGDLVWDIAEDSNALWVTTDRGISRYGFDSKNWSSWYWHPRRSGGWS